MGNFQQAMDSFSRSLTILQDFEKTGYHDPSIKILQNNLASLAAEGEGTTIQ
jgi:hypothetical protein